MKHVTAREARELLNHAAHGPWEAYDPGDGTARLYTATDADGDAGRLIRHVDGWHVAAGAYMVAGNGHLAAAAPDLAATLVWLYGREPGRDGAHGIGLRTIRPAGGYVEMDGYEMRPETAVDLARALLAAAKAATGD